MTVKSSAQAGAGEGSSRLLSAGCLPFALSVVLVCSAGCRDAPPLTSLSPTKEALAQAVVDALADRDLPRLESLAISEKEFKRDVWLKLPASEPKMGMPVDYIWADTSAKSRGYLMQTLAEHGGQRWRVSHVAFSRPPTDYGTFRVHPDTRLSLRNDAGEQAERRLFGSMLETQAGWKVYSYIVD